MEQLSLEDGLAEGRRRRDRGMRDAEAATWTGWRLVAERWLRHLAATGDPFTAEDLRELAGDPLGSSDNSMGALIAAAARRGEIVPVGFVQATRPEAHARVIRQWKGNGPSAELGPPDVIPTRKEGRSSS